MNEECNCWNCLYLYNQEYCLINEDYIEVTAKSNNGEKTYKITNEKELTLSMDGTIIKDICPYNANTRCAVYVKKI